MDPTGRHQALHAVLDVIDALESGPRGISDIARDLEVSKGGVHKILRNLEQRGLVASTPDHRYRLGLRLWELGTAAVAGLGLRQIALPYMEKLTDVTGEGSLLSVYDGGDVVYLEKVVSPQPVVATTRIGGRTPAFCSATGKAILAWQPADEIERVLAGPLERFNDATVTEPRAIRADLARVREIGYAVNHGTWRGEIHGVAAPIRDHSGSVVAALGITGPAYRFEDGGIDSVAPLVVTTAEEISRELGWSHGG
ncbi:MAG: IclR family transcriptional regulator [Nocardioidaceae bacterium]